MWKNADVRGFLKSLFLYNILLKEVCPYFRFMVWIYGLNLVNVPLKDGGINFDDKVVVILPCHVEY